MIQLPLNCWPKITDPGLVCECGEFKISGVHFYEARRRWWEHAIKEAERKTNRVHQDRT